MSKLTKLTKLVSIMQIEAKLNYLRIAPRKMRLLADLVRGKKVSEAKALLDFSLKKGSEPLKKLLDSAVSNARNNFQLEEDTLYISKIAIDEGPKLKRWRARARGRAAQIQKKTSHIILILKGEKRAVKKQAPKEVPRKAEEKVEKEVAEGKEGVGEVRPKAAKRILKPKKEITSGIKRGRKVFTKIFRRKSF